MCHFQETPTMPDQARTAAKIILALAIGAAANFTLTIITAPDHIGTALAVGLLLTSFGLVFAAFAMQALTLPIAIASLVVSIIKREKLTRDGTKRDKIEIFGRILFVAIYAVISAATGIYVGILAGGMGWFATAFCFFILGILLAILLPEELMWAIDQPGGPVSEDSCPQHEQLQEGLRNNEPVSIFTDKLAKRIVKTVTGELPANKPDDKR